nr:DnaJ domain protein [Aspergillus niger CBS 513.88]|eukprot:XP_001398845.2 DnaJ domain protein [Aspergillus niger CBS 513.88]
MAAAPDIDPYEVLGVARDAALSDIKSAHRKLVLKCHPDKIKDESLRSQAQDEFQKVQQAYETLSDETRRAKYDAKARLAELRRQMHEQGVPINGSSAYAAPRASGSSGPREYRNGRYYEERTPADAATYSDDDLQFSEESRSTSRKYDEYKKRYSSKPPSEKKKSKSDGPSTRAAKDMARDNSRTTHSSRAKYRTRERQRDAYDASSTVYVKVKRPSERRNRESSSRKSRPADLPRRHTSTRYEDEYTDDYESKHDKLHHTAKDYIRRSKGTVPIEIDRRPQASRSPPRNHGYESADPESSSSRHSGRTKRPSKESVRTSNSRNGSYEKLEAQARSYDVKIPSIPTTATSPSVKIPSSVRPSLQPSRSASAAQSYSRARGMSRENPLHNMVHEASRTAKLRTDKYDSGYSSPGTPEMAAGESPPKSTRYKIVTEPDTVLREPSIPLPQKSPRYARGGSPPHQERPMPKPPVRSSTYTYPTEHMRYESAARPSMSRQSSSRPTYGEIRSPKDKEYRYAREVGPDYIPSRDAYMRQPYGEYPVPPPERRQSTYAG